METVLRWFVPIYLVSYILIAFVWRSYMVWKRTGVNPVVLPSSDDAYGFVATQFKVCMGVVFFAAMLHTFAPSYVWVLVPIEYLELGWLKVTGVILLVLSLVWIAVAQAQMGASWRIGIDQANRTALVRAGLFRLSRNPIFLGMMVSLFGFFLVYPTAITLLILVSAYILIAVQIRLEEAHLANLHGDDYQAFRQAVRRWI